VERRQLQDLYEVLQVSHRAHPLIITKAFRLLAALYHPDNKQTGDAEAFKQVAEAYRVLSDPLRRAAYDRENSGSVSPGPGSAGGVESDSPLSPIHHYKDERELRHLILRALYDLRRGHPYKPSLSLIVLSELFGCSIDDLQFTLWYLRGKGLIDVTDNSDTVITVAGVDYLEANGLGGNGTGAEQVVEEFASLPLPSDLTIGWSPTQSGNRNGSRGPECSRRGNAVETED
jgi:curved DNA-binding protein